MRPSSLRFIIFSFILSVLMAACATTSDYYNNLNNLVSAGNYKDAVILNEQSKEDAYGKKNALLYYLDRGLLLHFNGDYKESNIAFENAKRIAADYFTKSITAEASTLLINDNMRPYYGEDFERAWIHVFCALNYVFLGQENEALVEARQVDHFLKTLKVNYNRTNVYTEDAFIRYLMGMLYENRGEINDAFISYRNAMNTYESYLKLYNVQLPKALVNDMLRTAAKLGFSEEIREIKNKWKGYYDTNAPLSGGEIVVINYNGLSPVKIDNFFEISFGMGWGYVESADVQGEEEEKVEQARAMIRSIASEEQVRLAFPKYVSQKYQITGIDASLGSGAGAESGVVVEDIGKIAVKGLSDRINRIRARTIARAVLKFVLAKNVEQKVEKSSGELSAWFAKTVLKAVSTATELSDKRSWRSLPDRIEMARLPATEGTHSVNIVFKNSSGGNMGTRTVDNIKVASGKKTFIAVRTAR